MCICVRVCICIKNLFAGLLDHLQETRATHQSGRLTLCYYNNTHLKTSATDLVIP